jgi:excisionase family DNA binding protein
MEGMLSGADGLIATIDPRLSNEVTAGLDNLLTVVEAARFLNVTVSWVYEHDRADERLPVVKLGKYLRFDRRDLRAYIDSKREDGRRTRRRR